MTIRKDKLTVFFFGSPAEGFTSYPSKYSDLVGGLDKSVSSFILDSKYSVKNQKTIIYYVEYGLSGVGQNGKPRGGRNFGFRIEIEDFKLDSKGNQKLLNYLHRFIQEGVVKNTSIFSADTSEIKHYLIYSFDEVSTTLDKLIEKFKINFISDFENHFVPISKNSREFKDLNPAPEERKQQVEKKYSPPPLIDSADNINSIEELNHTVNKESYNFDYHKLLTLLSFLMIIYLFVAQFSTDRKIDSILSGFPDAQNNKPNEGSIGFTTRPLSPTSYSTSETPSSEEKSDFEKLVESFPKMYYISSDGEKLMFRIKYFKANVDDTYKFSSSKVVIKYIADLMNVSPINTLTGKKMNLIKLEIQSNNGIYLRTIDTKINNKSSNYADIKDAFTKDFIILINE